MLDSHLMRSDKKLFQIGDSFVNASAYCLYEKENHFLKKIIDCELVMALIRKFEIKKIYYKYYSYSIKKKYIYSLNYSGIFPCNYSLFYSDFLIIIQIKINLVFIQ